MVLTKEQKELTDNITSTIKENKKSIRETSLKQYVSTLRKFCERTGIPPEHINSKPEEIITKFEDITDLQDNTLKNILISLMVYANKEAKAKYEPLLNKFNQKYIKKMGEGDYNPTQEAKSKVSMEQLQQVLSEFKTEAKKILKEKKNSITNKEHDTLTNYLLLELYIGTNLPPLRNDYREILLSNNGKYKDELADKQHNYYIVPKGIFIINHYKTSNKHGSIVFTVGDELRNFIKKYISFSPDMKWLFYNQNLQPYSSSAFSNKINKIFKDKIGINISTTMLRHLYLTAKYGDYKKEMAKDANIMGHSVNVQQEIYVK